MAYTKKTLTNLLQSLADKHDAGILPTSSATLSYWTRILNEGNAYCSEKLRLEKSSTLSIASGTVALPDDFKSIKSMINADGEKLSRISKDDSALATAQYYWITGNHTDGFSLNCTEDGDYTVYYTFRVSEMVNGSDVCVIPDPEAVVQYAYSRIRKAETDPLEDADQAMAECNRRLEDIIDDMQLNDAPICMTLQMGA